MQGAEVLCTIFGGHINVLKDTLKIYQTYLISNAFVRITPPEHCVIDKDYQWFLYAGTPIAETTVQGLNIRDFEV